MGSARWNTAGCPPTPKTIDVSRAACSCISSAAYTDRPLTGYSAARLALLHYNSPVKQQRNNSDHGSHHRPCSTTTSVQHRNVVNGSHRRCDMALTIRSPQSCIVLCFAGTRCGFHPLRTQNGIRASPPPTLHLKIFPDFIMYKSTVLALPLNPKFSTCVRKIAYYLWAPEPNYRDFRPNTTWLNPFLERYWIRPLRIPSFVNHGYAFVFTLSTFYALFV